MSAILFPILAKIPHTITVDSTSQPDFLTDDFYFKNAFTTLLTLSTMDQTASDLKSEFNSFSGVLKNILLNSYRGG